MPNHFWFKWEPTITEVFQNNHPRTKEQVSKYKNYQVYICLKPGQKGVESIAIKCYNNRYDIR